MERGSCASHALVYSCVSGMGTHSWRCYFSRLTRLSVRWVRLCPQPRQGKRPGPFWQLWSYGKIIFNSLYFNVLTNWDTVLDSIFEPVYWLVDNLTRWFGVVSWLIWFLLFSIFREFPGIVLVSPWLCIGWTIQTMDGLLISSRI